MPCTKNSNFTENDIACLFLHFTKLSISITCLCIEYPLNPHFYIVKLGYAGVSIFFLFLPQNIDCG